jgi:hypothetical protein
MRDIPVLLFLCRPLRDVKMFCTLQHIQELMTAKKGSQEQQFAGGKTLCKPKWAHKLQNSYSAPFLTNSKLHTFRDTTKHVCVSSYLSTGDYATFTAPLCD